MHLCWGQGLQGSCRKVKGGRVVGEAPPGGIASLYLANRRASRLGVSDAIPATAAGEGGRQTGSRNLQVNRILGPFVPLPDYTISCLN